MDVAQDGWRLEPAGVVLHKQRSTCEDQECASPKKADMDITTLVLSRASPFPLDDNVGLWTEMRGDVPYNRTNVIT
jgi:hypothetical protein